MEIPRLRRSTAVIAALAVTALAFLLGAEKGIYALVVGMLLAVVITAISNKLNDRDQKQAFPLVPFLWIGATLAYMI